MAFHSSRNIPLTDLEITFLGKNDGKKGGRVTEQARREVKKKKNTNQSLSKWWREKREKAIFSYVVLLFYTQV